jgi:hypothetical protein
MEAGVRMKIQRYGISVYRGMLSWVTDSDGEWCKWTDVEAALKDGEQQARVQTLPPKDGYSTR